MRKAFLLGLMALWLGAGTSCGPPAEQPAPKDANSTAPASSASSRTPKVKYHQGHGRVVDIDPKGRYIVIRHQEIKGFMEPMTMPFHPASPTLAKTVRVGEEVEFTLEETAEEVRLTAIRRVPSR